MKFTGSLVALLSSLLLFCSGARAHAHLKDAMPADDAALTSPPTSLSLAFSEGLEVKLSCATLRGPDGAPLATGPTSLGADKKSISIAIPEELGTGAYTVDWHAFSNDGHTTRGTYHFKVGR